MIYGNLFIIDSLDNYNIIGGNIYGYNKKENFFNST